MLSFNYRFENFYLLLSKNILKILIFLYVLAFFFPGVGVSLNKINLFSSFIKIKFPSLLLSFLLFHAGFLIHYKDVKKIFTLPKAIIIGISSNILCPWFFAVLFTLAANTLWHNQGEVQVILLSLAIISSMPVAGSSTAYVDLGHGNMVLILGVVVLSTLLSPFFSPLVFQTLSSYAFGRYFEGFELLANDQTSYFLVFDVILPSLCGIIIRGCLSHSTYQKINKPFKVFNLFNLFLLNYINASISLPKALSPWDPDYLALILFVTSLLCCTNFLLGWKLPKYFGLQYQERVALAYALGMNNNGTGLVLASMALSKMPGVLVPIIFYNLEQQIIAGLFTKWILKNESKRKKSLEVSPLGSS